MNFRDFIIIYLACGAPFGVYYFIQNRKQTETKFLLLKSLIRFVFWIPFAIKLVARKSLFTKLYKNGFDNGLNLDANQEAEIDEIKKFFENNIFEMKFLLSIYEFREIFERYIGLTLEIQNNLQGILLPEQEIFRISNHNNKKLDAICLNRRNRKRLSFHQKLARSDFFEVLGQLIRTAEEPHSLFYTASKLFKLLKDIEAQDKLEKLSKEFLQTQEITTVNNLEIEPWKSENQKPIPANRISTNLQIMSATAKLSNKD